MIDGLKPYPAMKDSGVPWLGQVPEHWDVETIGRLGALFKGKGGSKADEASAGVPCVRYGDLYTRYEFFISSSRSFIAAERANAYTPIDYGDVLFAASGETIEDIGRSAANLMKEKAVCGGDVIVLRPQRAITPRFLGYATNSFPVTWQKSRFGKGFTIVHLYGDDLKRVYLPVPPPAEQDAIVRFLDHADRLIRRYIGAKRKLIRLLEEQKQAIIHRAVTRGLDPNVRLKPSGVEWLGDVPAHWEVMKLRHCGSVVGGMTPSMSEPTFWGGDVPWVTPKDMKKEIIEDTKVKVTTAALAQTALRLIPAGSVLMVVRGMILARRVPIALTSCPVTINQDMKAIVPVRDVLAAFLARLLSAAQGAFVPLIDEAGHGTKRFPTDRWQDLLFAFPPRDEQVRIVDYLRRATADAANAIAAASRKIALLQEYRTRLIADVVTGKLDVRAAAAALPDPQEAPDDLEAEAEAPAEEELEIADEEEVEKAAA